jgi:hypothetical protein
MTVAQRINQFIGKLGTSAWCDDCIAKALSLPRRQQVAAVTIALGTTSDFIREPGICPKCDSVKEVIRAHRT